MKSTLTTLGVTIAVILITFTGCKKDLEMMEPASAPTQATTMENMKVNPGFDWKTFQNVQVDIKSNAKAVVYIQSDKGTVYHKAMTNTGETYQTAISVPTYEKEVKVLLAGQTKTVPIANNRISASF